MKTGNHSELVDDLDPLPDDVDDPDKFLPIPDKTELDLGKPLALDPANSCPAMSTRSGNFSAEEAYARFKDLLAPRGALDHWYAFEARAAETALRLWCEDHSIELID